MDRPLIYSQEQPRSYDILWGWRSAMTSAGFLEQDLTGVTTTVVSGFAGTPTSPNSLTVNLAAGRIYQNAEIDATSYGSLTADVNLIQQQGIVGAQSVTLSTSGLSVGQSRWALIEIQFAQIDVIPASDPTAGLIYYYNSSSPSTPYQGPGGSGTTQNTERTSSAIVNLIYGAAAITGSEVPPNPTSGFTPLYLIDLTYGQTAISSGEILTAGPSVGTNVPSNYPAMPLMAGLLNSHHDGNPGQAPKINLATETQGQLPGVQTALTQATTYYISTTGSDSTGTGSSINPWATLQHAWNWVSQNVNAAGYAITFQLANGTYTAGLGLTTPAIAGAIQGGIIINGNNGSSASVLFSTTSATAFTAGFGAIYTIQNLKIQTTTGGDCVAAVEGGQITLGAGLIFGDCAGSHIKALFLGQVIINDSYTISGNAINHYAAQDNGCILFSSGSTQTVTISGSLTFTQFAYATDCGVIDLSVPPTFTAAATGKYYTITLNGVINTYGSGSTYLPGGTSGTTATGGQYA